MGALSFKKRFIPNLKAGLRKEKEGKRGSIRNFRKRPLKVGKPVYLYYAQRTKQCKYIGEDVIKSVQVITIAETGITIYDLVKGTPGIDAVYKLSKIIDTKQRLNKFARLDGFTDFEDMKSFWKATHKKKGNPFPYTGNFYQW